MLATDSSVVPPAHQSTLRASGLVAFDHTEFSYPGADSPVLRNISFTAEPGQTTAIIGSTGAGKSTLISLIPRLFDATGGSVTVDGVEVRECDPELLWSRIGLIPQKALLFSGTVANAGTAIQTLPTGSSGARFGWLRRRTSYARCWPIGGTHRPIGISISGGQRQRLSISAGTGEATGDLCLR